MEEITKRLLELLRTDEPLRKAVLDVLEAKALADGWLAEYRKAKTEALRTSTAP